MLVSFSAFFGKGTVPQLIAISFLSLFWTALQMKVSPYRFWEENVYRPGLAKIDPLTKKTNKTVC